MKNTQSTCREFATYEEQTEYLREIDREEIAERKQEEKQQFRDLREVQWDRFTSNSSGTFSEVHVTFDGKRTLCSKDIPVVKGKTQFSISGPADISGFSEYPKRIGISSSGWGSSESGRTQYDLFVEYSSTTLGLYYPNHKQNGTCKCCVKRSKGKFINNHRTNSRAREEATK